MPWHKAIACLIAGKRGVTLCISNITLQLVLFQDVVVVADELFYFR